VRCYTPRMFLATVLVLAPAAPQQPGAVATTETPIAVRLTATEPGPGSQLRWSPKGATVTLRADGDRLAGSFPLGPAGTPPVRVELSRSPGADHFDRLALDCDRDGRFGDDERQQTTPKENRGKWWSSFEATVQVPSGTGEHATRQPYPMALWFVFDPQEPEAAPALRWSRRGWHEGSFDCAGQTVHVLLTESAMDGIFTAADSWQIGADRAAMLDGEARPLSTHNWLGERAFRITAFAPDGTSLAIAPFDPGITRAEEKDKNDHTKADRLAKRAEVPLAFGHDLAAALVAAARDGKRVFVDFETTWCGPCAAMDRLVYTAADVVAAANDVIAVKVDGDEHRDLVKQYAVAGYPTLLLLGPDGKELRRTSGYQGVAAMVLFFAK